MVIDLKKYFLSDDCADTITYSYTVEGVEINGVQPFSKPVAVTASLKSENGAVRLQLDMAYQLKLPCDRCFEEAVADRKAQNGHLLVRELLEEEEDGVYVLVPDETLDLDELVYADVLLSLPSKFLCKKDCAGLCGQCGANKNLSPCSCKHEKIDPRLEVLKQLLDKD